MDLAGVDLRFASDRVDCSNDFSLGSDSVTLVNFFVLQATWPVAGRAAWAAG